MDLSSFAYDWTKNTKIRFQSKFRNSKISQISYIFSVENLDKQRILYQWNFLISSIFEIVYFQLFGILFVDTCATNEVKFNESKNYLTPSKVLAKFYVRSAKLCSKSGATLQHRGQKTFFIISELSDSHGHIKLVCRPCSVRRSKCKKRKKIDSLSISTNRELPLLSTVNTVHTQGYLISNFLFPLLILNIKMPFSFHQQFSFVLKFAFKRY